MSKSQYICTMKKIPIDLKIHLLELEIKSINLEIEKLKIQQSFNLNRIVLGKFGKGDNQIKPQSNTLNK